MKLDNVSFRYGKDSEVLKNLNLEIARNSFVSLLGPSGCGKSTLLNLLAGFMPVTNGIIQVDGKPVEKSSTRKGFVFQDLALFPWLTVTKNVEFGLKMQGVPKAERKEKAKKLIELVGLTPYTDFAISSLSGGMKQRVALARTIAPEPEVLFLDEPFSALDAQTRDVLQEELRDLHKRLEMTSVLVTHSIDEAIYLSDYVVLMSRNGTIADKVKIEMDGKRDRTSAIYNEYESRLYNFLQQERNDKKQNIS